MLGIDAKETETFQSKYDTGEPKTEFTLGIFTTREKLKVFGGSMDAKGQFDMSKFQDKILDILEVGVKGIKNLGGKDYAGVTPEILDALPFEVVMELFERIMAINFVTEDAKKN